MITKKNRLVYIVYSIVSISIREKKNTKLTLTGIHIFENLFLVSSERMIIM